jgi:hypothetical protein
MTFEALFEPIHRNNTRQALRPYIPEENSGATPIEPGGSRG